jgi:peptide/nickel transport system substrate-binding protein
MTDRRDRALVGGLILTLVLLAGLVALPTPQPTNAAPGEGTPTPSLALIPTYREGIVGHPDSVTPVTARTRADRELVGLIFSGLVRLGPGTSILPDLAESWTTDKTGKIWTFTLRDDATWHDGEPVTADDVVFTANALKAPEVAGPAAASWAEVTAEAVDERTVRFTLDTPLGGFLEAATQPILPAHLLAEVPLEALDVDRFAREPIGSGPYRLVSLSDDRAVLEPASLGTTEPVPTDAPGATDALAPQQPSLDPGRVVPYIPRIELRFFDDADALADAYRSGNLNAASGLPPAMAMPLSTETSSRLVRYPTTTLASVLLDLRPSDRALRDSRVRRALLGALDRDSLITGPLGGSGLPPGSWAFDVSSATKVPFDIAAAKKSLTEAGWKQVDGKWQAPGAKAAYSLEVLAPTVESNPGVNGLAQAVIAGWTSFGVDAKLVELEPVELAARLRDGQFTAAVVDIAFNLDPDLYPLLASTQATTRGMNLSGLQDAKLDELLQAARKPGTPAARSAAYAKLEAYLATSQPILPLAWRDETMVVRGVDGPAPRLIARPGDRYHDVLTWRLASGG